MQLPSPWSTQPCAEMYCRPPGKCNHTWVIAKLIPFEWRGVVWVVLVTNNLIHSADLSHRRSVKSQSKIQSFANPPRTFCGGCAGTWKWSRWLAEENLQIRLRWVGQNTEKNRLIHLKYNVHTVRIGLPPFSCHALSIFVCQSLCGPSADRI